jgi:hypothetical protein
MPTETWKIDKIPADMELSTFRINLKILEPKLQKTLKDLHPSTRQILCLIMNLMGDNDNEAPAILLYPNKIQQKGDDMIEFYHPLLKNGIGIYSNVKGDLYFSVLDNSSQTGSKNGEKPKVNSTKKTLDDAIITKQTLADFLRIIKCRDISADGPNEREPFVVMTKPNSLPIATSSEGNILGIVFKPIANRNTRSVHGKVQLLVGRKV